MGAQPHGRVTLVFTDIEGSTRLLRELGEERYWEALGEHRRHVREAFSAHEGYEVDYEGDAFFYAFQDAAGAVAAVLTALESLSDGPVRIRVGVHTGEPGLDPPKYVGLDVHIAARIMSAGHGGQVLLSKAALEAAGGGVEHSNLGEHRLKDLEEPLWLFQLGGDSFPPLKTISNTNLPRPAGSFVGRQRELREVTELLRDGTRLLTLSGPGGAGKTRLAIEAATELVPAFPNGVYWVPLVAVRDPALVAPTISQTLGSKNGLVDDIGDRELLLVVDNLEQVVDAAPELAGLVESCRNLRVLVTSRERLRVRGERTYAVPALSEAESVELFCARSGLGPDEATAELCERLDRLPLALELAAARAVVLSPRQILERLGTRLDLLKGGRDAEARHATLRATLEWSHELLSPDEQQLFARLSVFRGGWTIDDAGAAADAELDTLQSLLEKSMLCRDGERFTMLETVRELAAEQLAQSGEADAVRRRHARVFLGLAERVEAQAGTGDRSALLDRLEPERGNYRAALDWAAESGEPELQLRLAVALRKFWEARGPLGEGLLHLERAIRGVGDELPEQLLDALRWAALSALEIGDAEAGERFASKAVALAHELGDVEGEVSSLIKLTHAAAALDQPGRAHALIEQGVALARDSERSDLEARALINYGALVAGEGDHERAAVLAEQSLAVGGERLEANFRAIALHNLAEARINLGQTGEAVTEPLLQLLELTPQHGDYHLVAFALELLAKVQAVNDPIRAATLLGAANALFEKLGVEADEQATALVLSDAGEYVEQAYRAGLDLDVEAAVAYGLQPSEGVPAAGQ